jgi:pre-mRNA-splicing factor 18
MDFASLMSAAISKSTAPPPTKPTAAPSSPPPKYLKRADLEAQRLAAYEAEKQAAQVARDEAARKKRAREEETLAKDAERDEKRRRLAAASAARREEEAAAKERARRKRLGLPEPVAGADAEDPAAAGAEDIEDAELVARLRALGEPAVLFGEGHAARLRRYRILTAPRQVLTAGPIPTSLVLVEEAEMRVPQKVPAAGPEREFLFRQLASYFTLVLTEWEIALQGRPLEVKESFQGRQAEGAWEQSRENMRPLFRKFERGELEEGILGPVVEIVRAAQERRYVDANDGYLTLSIGKA